MLLDKVEKLKAEGKFNKDIMAQMGLIEESQIEEDMSHMMGTINKDEPNVKSVAQLNSHQQIDKVQQDLMNQTFD